MEQKWLSQKFPLASSMEQALCITVQTKNNLEGQEAATLGGVFLG